MIKSTINLPRLEIRLESHNKFPAEDKTKDKFQTIINPTKNFQTRINPTIKFQTIINSRLGFLKVFQSCTMETIKGPPHQLSQNKISTSSRQHWLIFHDDFGLLTRLYRYCVNFLYPWYKKTLIIQNITYSAIFTLLPYLQNFHLFEIYSFWNQEKYMCVYLFPNQISRILQYLSLLSQDYHIHCLEMFYLFT